MAWGGGLGGGQTENFCFVCEEWVEGGPRFRLPKSGLNSEVVFIWNIIS